MEDEQRFACPYCWQQISMLIDWSGGDQRMIQDCEVCCNPIEIAYGVDGAEVIWFEAEQAQ